MARAGVLGRTPHLSKFLTLQGRQLLHNDNGKPKEEMRGAKS